MGKNENVFKKQVTKKNVKINKIIQRKFLEVEKIN